MKKKRGVTLVELLVVIAIIGFLSAISLPAYNTIKKKAAERTLENKISMLEVAAYNYGNDNKNDVAANPGDYFNITIDQLITEGYLSSESEDGNFIINPVTGLSMTETVKITYENYRIKAQINNGASGFALVVLTDGGTWDGISPKTLFTGGSTAINNPTKNNYTFNGWTVNGTGSTLVGTTFTMGTANTTLIANWTLNSYILTVDANGGTWGGITPQTIQSGASVSITTDPVKNGYVFSGWTLSGVGSTLVGATFTMGTANATLTANWVSYLNMFTYSVGGNPGVIGTDYIVLDDTNYNWRIKFLTSGTFTPLVNLTIDTFIVGGGGGGGCGNASGSGGGGGYTGTWSQIVLNKNQAYSIIVGSGGGPNVSGGSSSGFGYSKNGGSPGNGTATYTYQDTAGGAGGSGGGGNGSAVAYEYWNGGNGGSNGSNGSNGASGTAIGGVGQGTTTREFGEVTGALYAGGGGGAGYYVSRVSGAGGAGGGGRGFGDAGHAVSGTANTGGGGGGANYSCSTGAGSGGSGIVIIRNHR